MIKTYFVPAYFANTAYRDSASARYRAIWPSKYIKDSKLWTEEDDTNAIIDQTDSLILQKLSDSKSHQLAKRAKAKNKLVILDLTDPIWKSNSYFPKIIEDIDLVIMSSEALRRDFRNDGFKKQVYVIEDGEDLSTYDKVKTKYSLVRDKPVISWTGMRDTYPNLYYALELLREYEGEFFVKAIADEPPKYKFKNLEFYKWSLEGANEEIIDSDIFINPRDPKIDRNKLKSNNKTNLAWALKVPSIYDWRDPRSAIKMFNRLITNQKLRERNAFEGNKRVIKFYNMDRFANNFESIIDFHTNKKNKLEFLIDRIINIYKLFRYGY